MSRPLMLISLLSQFGSSFVALYISYILLLISHGELGIITIMVQPFIGGIVCGISILLLFIIGLPLRLYAPLHRWWVCRPWLPVFGIFAGFMLFLLSLQPFMQHTQMVLIDEVVTEKRMPPATLLISGWSLTGFSLLHFYPLYLFFRRRR